MIGKRPANAPYRAAKFLAAISMVLAAVGVAAEEIKIGGSGTTIATLELLGQAYAKRNVGFRVTIVPNLGSSGGIKALAAGAIDLAGISRPLNSGERGLGLAETEYGRTPFVFAVSTKSKVAALSLRQLADLYAGKQERWPDGTPVRIVLRPPGDIDTHLVRTMSPEMEQALATATQRRGIAVSMTDQDAADDIERIAGAIGPSSLALLISEKRAVKALVLDGKEPTPANIASGAYPYHKRVFVATTAQPSATVQRFIAFIRSPEGRDIVSRNGHWIP